MNIYVSTNTFFLYRNIYKLLVHYSRDILFLHRNIMQIIEDPVDFSPCSFLCVNIEVSILFQWFTFYPRLPTMTTKTAMGNTV